jgi:hypothetical protein
MLNTPYCADFSEFAAMVVPPDYRLHPATGAMQGVVRLTQDRSRRVDRPMTPRSVGLEAVDAGTGKPLDPVQLVRDKLTSRASSANDGHPARQLRQVFRAHDPTGSGAVSDQSFRRVLNQLNIYVHDDVFTSFARAFRRPDESNKIDYKRFMRAVLVHENCRGWGPHVPTARQQSSARRRAGPRQAPSSRRSRQPATAWPNASSPPLLGKVYTPRAGLTGKIGSARWNTGLASSGSGFMLPVRPRSSAR